MLDKNNRVMVALFASNVARHAERFDAIRSTAPADDSYANEVGKSEAAQFAENLIKLVERCGFTLVPIVAERVEGATTFDDGPTAA